MGMNLFEASEQWRKRPADERFLTLEEMLDACKGYAGQAAEAVVNLEDMRVDARENDLVVVGKEGADARFTNWSFKQMCGRVAAPSEYLSRLPAPLAADCINSGLRERRSDGKDSRILFHRNGSLLVRAFTSDEYSRIWNWEVCQRLLGLQEAGWKVPPARPAYPGQPGTRKATVRDCLRLKSSGLSVKVGDEIAPAGLYASDHDMFVFMVNEEHRIEDGSPGGLGRGFFVSNSEVGEAAFKIKKFLYRYVCGNHIVWDVKGVEEIKVRHVGRNNQRYGTTMAYELRKYMDSSAANDEQRIKAAKGFIVGDTKDEVLDKLFGMKILPRKTLEMAYELAVQDADAGNGSSPRTAYGMVQGVTALSQSVSNGYADKRVDMDVAAGKILQMAF